MNDTAVKNCCLKLRALLERGVEDQLTRYDIAADAAPAGSEVVKGRPLSPDEVAQRDELLRLQAQEGRDSLLQRAAYTWFNRLAAIRFMELRDWLSCGCRMLTRADGSAGSQAVDEALDIRIAGIDPMRVAELKGAGEDEPLFRYLFLLQCEELAECLPGVFDPVGSAMELLLPQGLLASDGAVAVLVEGIPEEDWLEGVTILGWMYQYYNAEVKDEFFKSKRKASAADIAPATQLFTPEWIVSYLVENSLGRLWMLNNPDSRLCDYMDYYVEPDAECEDFIRIASPEEITLCDPACGGAHFLERAFELLYLMYEERGYSAREIPELILTKNLSGMEIDPRAVQLSELVLVMRAREHDKRFFRRGVRANITVLQSIEFAEGETGLNQKLADELAHLGEIGSLFRPSEEDIAALRAEIAGCASDLFANAKKRKLERALAICEKLARRFTCVVANPPYMGSSSFNPFMSAWVKKNYPDVKSDLCTCFIERGFDLAKERGYAAMVTMQSWMFLGSFEKMRANIIDNKTIVSMAHLGPRAFDAIGGEVVNVTADVIYNGKASGEGAYARLVDINGSDAKRQKLVEAIQNPDCGWFYRADASTFHDIPGTPIAYWASEAIISAFHCFDSIKSIAYGCNGMTTGNNDLFLRLWPEVSYRDVSRDSSSSDVAIASAKTWFPYNKGGDFRRWYGNDDNIINWKNDGEDVRNYGHLVPRSQRYMFLPSISWSKISSAKAAFRAKHQGGLFDVAGLCLFPNTETNRYCLIAFCNSSVAAAFLAMLSPTLNFEVGSVCNLPYFIPNEYEETVALLAQESIALSQVDWDSQETSWDFKRNPLV